MTFLAGALLIVVAIQAAILVALLIWGKRHARAERALRESEEWHRRIADRVPVMIWTARPDTTLDYLNSTCVEFTGLPIEKLRDNGWMVAAHPEDLDAALRIYYRAVEARTPFVVEYRLRRADGGYRWVLDSGVPKYGPDGSFSGYIGCVVDITERKFAEDLTRESRVEVEKSHREIQQLAGRLITAHEDERQRLARELHDDLTQRLARLAIDAGRMESAVDAPEGMRLLRDDSTTVTALAWAWRAALLSASCATRNRQSDTSAGSIPGAALASTSTRSSP